MNISVRVTSWIVFGIAGLIFGSCLTAGIGWYWSAKASTPSIISNPPSTSPLLYKNILLLQVDSTQKDKSTIQSVWLLRLPVNRAARFEVFAFHPSTFIGRGGISQDLLQHYVIGTITTTLVFDRNNLSNYIDRLGGITVASQHLGGAGVWRYLDSADANYPTDLAIRQAAVAHSILVKMAAVSGRIDLDTLFGDSLAQSNYAELLAMLHYYYPMRTDSFRVQLVNPS